MSISPMPEIFKGVLVISFVMHIRILGTLSVKILTESFINPDIMAIDYDSYL